VVRPGGLVALITYHNAGLVAEVGQRLAEFYRVIEPYWPAGRAHVLNHYRDLAMPWPALEAPPLDMTAMWTRDELVGYISTWSATARLVAAEGERALDELRGELAQLWPGGEAREVRWTMTVKLARR
jgi:hypothetical protein